MENNTKNLGSKLLCFSGFSRAVMERGWNQALCLILHFMEAGLSCTSFNVLQTPALSHAHKRGTLSTPMWKGGTILWKRLSNPTSIFQELIILLSEGQWFPCQRTWVSYSKVDKLQTIVCAQRPVLLLHKASVLLLILSENLDSVSLTFTLAPNSFQIYCTGTTRWS